MENVIFAISKSCGVSESDALELFNSEVRYLKELAGDNDLRYSDIEQSCADLGIENDYAENFIESVGYPTAEEPLLPSASVWGV